MLPVLLAGIPPKVSWHTEAAEHTAEQSVLTSEDTYRAPGGAPAGSTNPLPAGAGLQVGSGEGHGPVDHAQPAV